jgi:hypothetical protein
VRERDPEFEKFKNENFTLIKGCNLFICDNSVPMVVDIGQVDGRVIPRLIKNEVTLDRTMVYIDMVSDIVWIPNPMIFGSLRQWVLFTDMKETQFTDSECGFLVDCAPGSNWTRVASILKDNYGNIAIDIVFDNLNEYNIALQKWENSRLELAQAKPTVNDEYATNSNKDIALICDHFSSYVRISNNLSY